VNQLSSTFVAANGEAILLKLRDRLAKANDKVVKTLLDRYAEHITWAQFDGFLKKSKLAHMVTSKIFARMDRAVRLDHRLDVSEGVLIRNLPDDVFANLNTGLHESWFKYMTEAQMRNFQRKVKKDDAHNILVLDKVGPQAIAGITPEVMKRYLASAGGVIALKDKHWKRISNDVFAKVLKDDEDGSIIGRFDRKAFAFMTKDQRQAILDAMGKTGNCGQLPVTLLNGKDGKDGKAKHLVGLTVSKKCFKSIRDAGTDNGRAFRFRTLMLGATEAASAKDIDAEEIGHLQVDFHPADKKKDPFDFHGMCAFEVLAKNKLGAEYMKNILKEDAEEKCQHLQMPELRKAKWLQTQLTRECIQAIPEGHFDAEAAKKMDANMWAGFNRKQLRAVLEAHGSGKMWKGLSEAAYIGLGQNPDFAHMALKRSLKETKEGEKSDDEEIEVFHKLILAKLPAEQVRKHFGAAFVNAVPEKDYEALAENIGLLADSALAGSDANHIRANLKADKITDAQFGRASDDLDAAGSYPASISSAEVVGLSTSRVAAFSPTFVSRLKAATIAAMSAEQVAAIAPASLVNVCGDAAAALNKHGLTEAQKGALGSACATGDNAAPCPFSASSILAVAAAAAGSAALLL
jgi:hypothetical protein